MTRGGAPPGPGAARAPGALRRALPRLALSALLLAALLVALDARELLGRVRDFVLGSPGAFALALLAFLLVHGVGALKWRLFLSVAGARLSRPAAARCYGFGLFANLCLPSVIGGDVVRAVAAMGESEDPREAILFGGVVDRLADLAALGLVVLVAAGLAPGSFDALGEASGEARTLLAVLFLGLLVLAAAGVLLLTVGGPRAGPRRLARVRLRFRRAWRASLRRPGRALSGLALAVLMQGSFVLVNAWIARRMGLALDLRLWFLAWPLAKIAGMLPISLGGIGVREVALAGFLRPFGAAAEAVVAQSLVWEAVLVAGGLAAGAAAGASRLLGRRAGAAP